MISKSCKISDCVIKSYVLNPLEKRIAGPLTDDRNKGRYLISISDIEKINSISSFLKYDPLDGAFSLMYKSEVLLDVDFADYIDLFWLFFLLMMKEFLENKVGEMSYPDMSIYLRMQWIDNQTVLLRLYTPECMKEWLLPMEDFLFAVVEHIGFFFNTMKKIFKENFTDESVFDDIASVKSRIICISSEKRWPFVVRCYVHDPCPPEQKCATSDHIDLSHFYCTDLTLDVEYIQRTSLSNTYVGFLYIDYQNSILIGMHDAYDLVAFFIQCLMAFDVLLTLSRAISVRNEVLTMHIKPITELVLHVTVCSENRETIMIVPKKKFLMRLLDIMGTFFGKIASNQNQAQKIYDEELALIRKLSVLINALSEE